METMPFKSKSDSHQFSPKQHQYTIKRKYKRINKIITKGKML